MATLQMLRQSLWPKIAGLLIFVGMLADVFGVSEHLGASSKAVAAFAPLVAWVGTASFGTFLAERLWWWIRDRKSKGPDRRRFRCLHADLSEARKKLEESMTRKSRGYGPEPIDEYEGRKQEADALVESLATELKQLGIATPPVGNIHESDKVQKWLKTLPRLVGNSSRGDLDAAIRLGGSWQSDSEEDADG